MDHIRDAARIARSLSLAGSREELWSTLKAFAAPFGFTHLSVMKRHNDLPCSLSPSIVYIDAPEGFAAEFDRQRLGPNHPLILQALTQQTPFSAGELRASQLSPEQQRVLRYISLTLNVRDGWTFPIAYCGELRGIIMLGGLAPDMSPLLCSLLHLLVHTAFKRFEELNAGVAHPRSRLLTAREVECLRWVALGKTDEEIGVILSIRARTARFHVENAKRKLGVATRVQAVAEALKQQAIAA